MERRDPPRGAARRAAARGRGGARRARQGLAPGRVRPRLRLPLGGAGRRGARGARARDRGRRATAPGAADGRARDGTL